MTDFWCGFLSSFALILVALVALVLWGLVVARLKRSRDKKSLAWSRAQAARELTNEFGVEFVYKHGRGGDL